MNARHAFLLWLSLGLSPSLLHADCTVTNLNMVPLPDLGIGQYKGFTGGLYPEGLNRRPPAHEAAGLNIALNEIAPRLLSGNIDATNGKIVLLSIGVSNTTQEWATRGPGAFKPRADADASKNPQVIIVDGAQGGQDTQKWTNRNAVTWTNVLTALTAAGVGSNQVQAVWLKHARIQPGLVGAFPVHAQSMQGELEMISRNLKSWFPNVKIAFCSSRTRSYDTNAADLNPEPFAYEEGFSFKWMIEKQINGDPTLNYDPNRGPAVAPFLTWGPYIWADGLTPRSDGFTWLCSDLTNDFTHPSEQGVTKVADQLLAFFKTDLLAVPWFLRKPTNGVAATDVSAKPTFGFIPMNAAFSNSVAGVRHWWTFGDGTFSTNDFPIKSFVSPGRYTALLTLTDVNGNWRTGRVEVMTRMTYDSWAQKKFTAAELTNTNIVGQQADPDGDGISNWLEFWLALEPKASNLKDPRLPHATLVGGFIEYSFSQSRYANDPWIINPQITGDVDMFTSPPPRSKTKAAPALDLNLIQSTEEGMTDRLLYRSSQPLSVIPDQFIRLQRILGP